MSIQNRSSIISNNSERKQQLEQFYSQFGIKQYSSFSGGFKYHEKTPVLQAEEKKKKVNLDKQKIYQQLGISGKNQRIDVYKIDNEYVPQTKNELADKLMEKIEHKMKKIKYYREKYYRAGQN